MEYRATMLFAFQYAYFGGRCTNEVGLIWFCSVLQSWKEIDSICSTFAEIYKMKLLNVLFVASVFLSSCGENKPQFVANKTINCTIEGMTCAEGCAKTIQEAVAEMPGITLSKVDFEKKIALFSFDSAKVNSTDILQKIQTIHEGQYKVSLLGAETPATEKEATSEEAVEVTKKEGEANS